MSQVRVLTLKDMVAWSPHKCGALVKYCFSRGFSDHTLPLTPENLQDMYTSDINVWSIGEAYELSFVVRKKPTMAGKYGSILEFSKGKWVLSLRARLAADLETENLHEFSIKKPAVPKLAGHWSTTNLLYQKPSGRGTCFSKEEIDTVKELAEKYSLQLMGNFRSKRKVCPTCHRELR